jgi:methylenetetrahydrofolate reductase (NADPH)
VSGLSSAIAALARGASLELMARDDAAIRRCIEVVERGSPVFIARVPGDTNDITVAAAVRLRQAGFNPVPHIGARYFASAEALDDLLARLTGEAAVEQVLCIAGDIDKPLGPYASSVDIIATGKLEQHGIRRVGIAGYPEGHPKIAPPVLAEAMAAKLARLGQAGIASIIVTQFCFEAAPIAAFVTALRERGIAAPVRIGLAGPASVATLAKFALRCGIGNSLRALTSGRGMARLLTDAGPEAIVAALARTGLDIAGLHFYTFGGVAKTGAWLNAVRAGDFALTGDEVGFRLGR